MSLSRQSAPSPQPIVDAKNEIINLQQSLSSNESTVQQLEAALKSRNQLIDQLKSDLAAKDISIQSLGLKISKKSEEISDLSEQLDLYKAKDSENIEIISQLKRAGSPADHTGSDADSIGNMSCNHVYESCHLLLFGLLILSVVCSICWLLRRRI